MNFRKALTSLKKAGDELSKHRSNSDWMALSIQKSRLECFIKLGDIKQAKHLAKKLRKAPLQLPDMQEYYHYLDNVGEYVNQDSGFDSKVIRVCSNPACLNVEKRYKEFQMCNKCKRAVYCSQSCQKVHWKRFGHEKEC